MSLPPRSVWVVESGDYEQRSVWCVAATVEAATAWIKSQYGPPYIIKWEDPVRGGDDEWSGLVGRFERVPNYSTQHTAVWDFTRYEVISRHEARHETSESTS